MVKWGSLVHLAKEQNIDAIFYVAMVTKSNFGPKLVVDGKLYQLDNFVCTHFPRCLDDIQRLGNATGIHIYIESASFIRENRSDYFDSVIAKMDGLPSPKIIFLDPDTGISGKTRTEKHVSSSEISRIWKKLSDCDWLMLYQHSHHSKTWKDDMKRKFQCSCGADQIRVYEGPNISPDVVFFACRKSVKGIASSAGH